jgi:hypothetical protein
MAVLPEQSRINLLRNRLCDLIVVPGFNHGNKVYLNSCQTKDWVVNQAWEVYRSFSGFGIPESQFKAGLRSATFLDQHSVETYLMAVLLVPFIEEGKAGLEKMKSVGE